MNHPQSQADADKYILYVDDEPQALKYFRQLFGDRFAILTAPSADEAMSLIREDPDRISVLVTDQRMPGRTGVELMEQVRHAYPAIVRVLTTAHTHLDSAIRAVNEGGAFRYLTKPWNDQEIIGTLLRAQEFHAATTERDRLIREKLSVLHRLVIMDRVRGLATMVTTLQGQLRSAWPALVAYMDQSPVTRRLEIQMEEIAQLNMIALARREAEAMVATVDQILRDTVARITGDATIDIAEVIGRFESERSLLADDDVDLVIDVAAGDLSIRSDAGMIGHMVAMMLRRLCDIQDKPAQLRLNVRRIDGGVEIVVHSNFDDLDEAHLAAFFAAAIPLKRFPIGLDMDLLACYLIAHHLGGTLQVVATAPDGPAIRVTLPQVPPPASPLSQDRFDRVFESLQAWQDRFDDDL